MAFPFTPHTTFTDDATPAINAEFLMAMQKEGVAPAAYTAWFRPPLIKAHCTDGSTVSLSNATVMCLDETTNKFSYAVLVGQTISTANLEPAAGSWPVSSWLYAYAVLTNGVSSIEISTTAPDTDLVHMSGDNTRRYLFSFYSDGSSNLIRFARSGRETRWLDRLYVHGSEGGGVAQFLTAGITHSVADKAPPHAQFIDLYVLAYGSITNPYILTISYLTDSGAQIRESVTNDVNSFTHKIWLGGQTNIFSDVTDQTDSYGWIRVLGWDE